MRDKEKYLSLSKRMIDNWNFLIEKNRIAKLRWRWQVHVRYLSNVCLHDVVRGVATTYRCFVQKTINLTNNKLYDSVALRPSTRDDIEWSVRLASSWSRRTDWRSLIVFADIVEFSIDDASTLWHDWTMRSYSKDELWLCVLTALWRKRENICKLSDQYHRGNKFINSSLKGNNRREYRAIRSAPLAKGGKCWINKINAQHSELDQVSRKKHKCLGRSRGTDLWTRHAPVDATDKLTDTEGSLGEGQQEALPIVDNCRSGQRAVH